MTIFLQNNGRPDLAPEKRRPFPLPAARAVIAVGERLAITAEVLAAHGYDIGEESAKSFATFVAGVYNGKRTPEWLSVIEGTADTTDAAPEHHATTETETTTETTDTTDTTATDDAQSAAPDTAGDPGQGETA